MISTPPGTLPDPVWAVVPGLATTELAVPGLATTEVTGTTRTGTGVTGTGVTGTGGVAAVELVRPRADPAPDSRLELDPEVGAARLARQFTTERCARWDVADLAEPACIAVTEMVNNVVAHAGTPMALRLRLRDGALQLAVRDHSRDRPSFTGPASPNSTGGRGLLLRHGVPGVGHEHAGRREGGLGAAAPRGRAA